MRPDMKKVIVAKPKSGGGRSSGTAKASKITEESPSREGKSRIGFDNKHTSGLYGPIRKFLQSKVGQRWDSVWSEVCKNSKDELGSVLRERVLNVVAVRCTIDEDGEFLIDGRRWVHYDFYVYPETNILTKSVNKPRRYPAPNLNSHAKRPSGKIYTMDGMEYYCSEDIWYRVRSADYVPKTREAYNDTIEDVFGSQPVNQLSRIYGSKKYIIWKQQANSKECAKLKELANGTTD